MFFASVLPRCPIWATFVQALAALLLCTGLGLLSTQALAAPQGRVTPTSGFANSAPDYIFADGFDILSAACTPSALDEDCDGLLDPGNIVSFVPPDPSAVAPPLEPTVITDFSDANQFIFNGDEPIQRGVAPGTIKPYRMAVLRGKVVDTNQSPLSGVLVRVLNHPEFGYTYTRADGVYDFAVNGGGEITVDYQKGGFLHAQRHTRTPWKNWRWLPQATMIALDPAVSTIALSANTSLQVHRANVVTDTAGIRQATVMFQPGTEAHMVLPDGSNAPLTSIHFRATEYTVGPDGPSRMPATLPGSIAYTYAVELSADEAIAANARSVKFNKPVSLYFENFLGFPVGEHIPLGYYDYRQGSWLPAKDGRIIKLLGAVGGLAEIDVDGSGLPASAQALADLGISNAERMQLAQLYPVGKVLWRAMVTHLTPWDCNFPYGPPPGAQPPKSPPDKPDLPEPPDVPPDNNPPGPDTTADDDPDPCHTSGSIIDCSNARLGEAVPLVGTPYALYYQSARLPGSNAGKYDVKIRVSLPELPPNVKSMLVEVSAAGRIRQI